MNEENNFRPKSEIFADHLWVAVANFQAKLEALSTIFPEYTNQINGPQKYLRNLMRILAAKRQHKKVKSK